MPIKKSILSSSRTEPYYAPCNQELSGTKCKVIQLKNLKCRGTLIKHKTPVPPILVFNSLNFENNPLMDVHDSANLRVQLVLSHDTCYLPGIFTQQESLATTTASARSSADDEMLLQSKSVFAGYVHITVKGQSGVLFQDLKVQLSGYSSEFVCLTQFGEKVVRLLKDLTSDSCSHLRPMIQDTIHFKPKLTLLSPGTYTYPFNFVLDPYHFHASIGTHLGSTQYRMELTCTIMRQKAQYETIFLSRPFAVKKTLPPGNLLRYDCVESQGTWRDGLLDYKIYLSTKLLEFDQPFQFHLHLVKGEAHQIEVQTIEVILEQNMLIPCVKKKDLHKPVAKAKSYMATNMFLLAKHSVTSKHDIQHILQFPDLLVSSSKQSIVMGKSLHPYYCEMSDTFGADRCKLKITHVLKAQVSLRLHDGGKVTNMLICLKLPVLLVDKDMSSGLHLPPYRESCSASAKDTLSTLCPTMSDDSRLCSSPPTYAELFDSAYPPAESSS